jgi:hypothetical protein
MACIKHPNLMASLAQDWRKRLDSQGRECHHLDPPIVRLRSIQFFGKHPAEIVITHENKKDFHNTGFCLFSASQMPAQGTESVNARNGQLRFTFNLYHECLTDAGTLFLIERKSAVRESNASGLGGGPVFLDAFLKLTAGCVELPPGATQESFCKIVKHYAGGRIWHFMLR